MTSLRRHLRIGVATWLVVQVASLSAFVPFECCAAHHVEVSDEKAPCHGEQPAQHHETDDDCQLRGSCKGPSAALLSLLSNHGLLSEPLPTSTDLVVSIVEGIPEQRLIRRLASPDPPPPRA
jgi:hypothetical protein